MAPIEHYPGDPAPCAGDYEELTLFGHPAGRVVRVGKDEKLPASARGFSWRPLGRYSVAELRERAAEYRRMAETARTAPIRDSLRKLAERFDALATRRDQDQDNAASTS